MRQIAFYGKGGSGKSTIAAHLSFALANKGLKVLQIGCDPKQDSTRLLLGRIRPTTILEAIKNNDFKTDFLKLEQIIFSSPLVIKPGGKIFCAESGGPEAGVGCAGKGVAEAIEVLAKQEVFSKLDLDVVIYDVLGDVVCGGFSLPIRNGYAKETYIITSGEIESLWAAANIAKAIARFALRSGARLGGIIGNLRGIPDEEKIISQFAQKLKAKVIGFIPHSSLIKQCSNYPATLFQFAPESKECQDFLKLADAILRNQEFSIPGDISFEDLFWFQQGAVL